MGVAPTSKGAVIRVDDLIRLRWANRAQCPPDVTFIMSLLGGPYYGFVQPVRPESEGQLRGMLVWLPWVSLMSLRAEKPHRCHCHDQDEPPPVQGGRAIEDDDA